MRKIYRQGDVVLYQVENVEGTKIEHDGKFTLAVGEATGHSHQILCNPENMQIFKGKRNQIILEQESELAHQQHKLLKLIKGKYVQVQEREVDHFAGKVKKVVD